MSSTILFNGSFFELSSDGVLQEQHQEEPNQPTWSLTENSIPLQTSAVEKHSPLGLIEMDVHGNCCFQKFGQNGKQFKRAYVEKEQSASYDSKSFDDSSTDGFLCGRDVHGTPVYIFGLKQNLSSSQGKLKNVNETKGGLIGQDVHGSTSVPFVRVGLKQNLSSAEVVAKEKRESTKPSLFGQDVHGNKTMLRARL